MKTIEKQLFTLDELTDAAQMAAYNEWVDDYRYSQEYIWDLQYSDVIHYGEKALASVGINAEWDSWDNCFPGNYADPYSKRYLPYITAADYMPENARSICHMEDFGYYSSMDMADAFNEYEAELIELVDAYENANNYDDQIAISDKFASVHIEACYRACKVLQTRYEEEKDDLESFEHFDDESTQGYEIRTRDNSGRVYYSDCRKWYTIDGEFYDQSNVNHECVSIMKVG